MQVLDREQLVLQAQDLEPLPATASRLASLVADPNTDMEEIVEVLSLDPALTVKLLRVANSASSAAQSEIGTVRQAVVRLGTGAVLSMAVAAGVRHRMMAALPGYDLREGQLWEHSVAAALAAESMPGLCRANVPPELFTAALLHDVGKLVLGRCLEGDVESILAAAREEGHLEPHEAEAEALSVDHAELGGLIAEHWELPLSIQVGIRYHHQPAELGEDSPLQLMPHFVLLADLVARRLGKGLDDRAPADQDFTESLDAVGMDTLQLEKLLYRASLRLDEIVERFG